MIQENKDLLSKDHEKAYRDLVDVIKELYPGMTEYQQEKLQGVYPELTESEDEKIRKEIVEVFKSLGDGKIPTTINYADIFTWLEKQGEQQKMYIRFGDIPENEESGIYCGEEQTGKQEGVSVYPATIDEMGNISLGLLLPITATTLHTQQHLLEYDNRPCYLVTGDRIGTGVDGEPLLKNVKIIKEVKDYRKKNDLSKQNPVEWSEDDEKMLQSILECLRNGWKKLPSSIQMYESWLKSLKPQHKQEWSDEDEKIRKNLIEFVNEYGDKFYGQIAKASAIFWLEKQGEQKTPKFKAGDSIQYNGYGHNKYTIKEVCGVSYYINTADGRMDMSYTDANFELVEQKPVEMIQWKGDNLKEVIGFTGKSDRFDEWFKNWEEFEEYVHKHGNILKLFDKQGSHYEVPVGAWIVKTPDGYNVPSVFTFKQKPAEWSEEDERMLKEIVSFFEDGTVKLQHDLDLYAGFLEKRLKSLKPQLKCEWSEEDELLLHNIIKDIEQLQSASKIEQLSDIYNKEIDWLRSIKPNQSKIRK